MQWADSSFGDVPVFLFSALGFSAVDAARPEKVEAKFRKFVWKKIMTKQRECQKCAQGLHHESFAFLKMWPKM
jgi:hypothetical protein